MGRQNGRNHIFCVVNLILSGDAENARAAVYKHVSEWPRDAMIAQMNTSVFGLIGFSGKASREADLLEYTENFCLIIRMIGG